MVLQLHAREVGHHHGAIAALTFRWEWRRRVVRDRRTFDGAVQRSREAKARVVKDVHVNPNAGRGLWYSFFADDAASSRTLGCLGQRVKPGPHSLGLLRRQSVRWLCWRVE
jgi:hypothetical protein